MPWRRRTSESTRGPTHNYLNTSKARTPTAKLFGEYLEIVRPSGAPSSDPEPRARTQIIPNIDFNDLLPTETQFSCVLEPCAAFCTETTSRTATSHTAHIQAAPTITKRLSTSIDKSTVGGGRRPPPTVDFGPAKPARQSMKSLALPVRLLRRLLQLSFMLLLLRLVVAVLELQGAI